jgi:ribosomal protein S18 acetylase RimI-like enzyme
VADALVQDVLEWAKDRGYQQVELGVTEGNDTARKLYLRHGFEPTGEWEDLISFPGLRIELMMREL